MDRLPPRAALIDPARYDLALKRTWAWREVEKLARKARNEAVRLKALENYLDRTDPKKNALEVTGPMVIRWATETESPSFPTLRGRSRATSTTASPTNGHAPPSSSATDALANL